MSETRALLEMDLVDWKISVQRELRAAVSTIAEASGSIVPDITSVYSLGDTGLAFLNLYLSGTAYLNNVEITGNTTIGDASTDTVTVTAQIASDLVPSTDNSRDIGSATKEWKDLYIDGTANIDSLVADTADINGGTVDGAIIGGASAAAGTFTDLTTTGNTILGNASTDTVTLNAQVASDVVASSDDARDLGSATKEWKDLYLDGVANIDSLVADTADINAGTIDNATIGGATPAAGTFTTLQSTGAFGCNNASAQTPYASGGALAAYTTGAFGLDSDAHMQALYNLVVAIRAALVANGIMS